MIDSRKKKDKQLGMPLGTASAKLRKAILFSLLKESHKNICYQCGEVIDREEELSIEHKIPWLNSDNPVKLFYDLDNIAFSHLRCNILAGRKPIVNSLVQEEKVRNGTHNLAKLSSKQVLEVRELSKTTVATKIAKIYNVSKHTIYRILKGNTYKCIK